MLKKLVNKHLRHRHDWRETGWDELSELYINTLFRGLALSITGLFVPVYLLQLHYPVTSILAVVAWYFTLRGLAMDILSGYTVARIGPKHTMLIGYGLMTVSTSLFLTLPHIHWPIWLLGGVWGASASYFFVPFNVAFSKVKHSKHGGKELGYINIMDKLGQALGPLIGGIVGTIFGAPYIFLVAVILLVIGTIPLFTSAEPVKLRQYLDFKGLKIDGIKRDIISFAAMGMENNICLYLWPLFIGLFILTDSTVYAKLGILASLSLVAGVLATHSYGKLIDKHQGREALRTAALINSTLHLFRPFIQSYPVAFGVNIVNETVTPGYRMPYFKAYYDAADDHPGHRIVYLSSLEAIASISKATMWWTLLIFSTFISARSVTTLGFLIAALASLTIMVERYKTLEPKAYNHKQYEQT